MQLRNAEKHDAACLAVLSIEVWFGTYIKRGVKQEYAEYALSEFTTEKFEDLLSDPNEHIIVSQAEDGITGFIRVSKNRPAPVECGATTEISTFYIQPRHHGQGIGRALLKEAILDGQRSGAKAMWLATNSENTPAIGFYLAQGFEQIGHTHFRMNDQAYLNNVHLYQFD